MAYEDFLETREAQIPTEVEQAKLDNAVAMNKVQLGDTLNQVREARANLTSLNQNIEERQKFYDGIYEQKQEFMKQTISDLENQITILNNQIATLDTEILDKTKNRDSIQSDFSEQQVILDKQKRDNEAQAASLALIQTDLVSRETDLKHAQEVVDQAHQDNVAEYTQKLSDIASQMADLENKKADNILQINELNALIAQEAKQIQDIEDKQKALDASVAVAQPIVDRAAEVQALSDGLDQRKTDLDERERQLNLDINQTKVTMVVVNDQKADLKKRQEIIEAAENKIATGG